MDYIIYFIITIGILVFVHEFGHFAAAKLSGMRADVFAIGFGKRLFGYNKINGFTMGDLPKDFDTQGHTDYRLCLLPLGGYVKIAGMVDESFDTEFANSEPKPYEFRAKPTYKKLFVITAGVMMNLTLTVLIFWGMNYFQGKQIIDTTEIGYIEQTSVAAEMGFETGDKVISINDKEINNWDDVVNIFLNQNLGTTFPVTVKRNNEIIQLMVDGTVIPKASQQTFFLPFGNTRPFVSEVMKNSPAEEAGIQSGDMFISIENEKVNNVHDVARIVSANPENKLNVVVLRGEDTVKTSVSPGMEGKIGVYHYDTYVGPIVYKTYGFFDSFYNSLANVANYTYVTFSMLENVIRGNIEFSSAFGGPVKIAQIAVRSADSGISSFLYFLAALSLSLAIINILPFPVLDGGHFVIILVEGILRRELPIKIKIAIQNFGFVVLLLLMAFIIYKDIVSF
ncbi:MAG: RIP metalloprotease RseP [Melioribacteraceae bacterium]|nr:RIP metalloprotease RseP [Melioribacteraceae bacterium]MCF8354742.1 RIP metalloprotease RseP [Melioribacteraceae bacterium]MCF8393236.1 RIP metalloprotease RseP [Melioribacteraceae bacterium]MCF8417537.1 RIP metalloprotease RseP [Melioribacteraceae bacterium]